MGSSVAGGGRYDKLIGRTLGHEVPACGFSIGFERIVDLLDRTAPRDAYAVLIEAEVPVVSALAIARDLRQRGRVIETIRRSGKIGAQLKRLEAAGFAGFVHVRQQDGALVVSELRPLAGTDG